LSYLDNEVAVCFPSGQGIASMPYRTIAPNFKCWY